MTLEQAKALRAIAEIFIEAVRAAGPLGAPGGHLYAACIGKLSLQQFEQIMSGLCRAGKLRKRGDCYHAI